MMKVNCLIIENPGPFSRNRAADARSLFCLLIPPQVSRKRERILCWEGLPHRQLCFITEGVLCEGVVISVCDRQDNGMLADSRNLRYHISLPK